jgi:hypothetical protein
MAVIVFITAQPAKTKKPQTSAIREVARATRWEEFNHEDNELLGLWRGVHP